MSAAIWVVKLDSFVWRLYFKFQSAAIFSSCKFSLIKNNAAPWQRIDDLLRLLLRRQLQLQSHYLNPTNIWKYIYFVKLFIFRITVPMKYRKETFVREVFNNLEVVHKLLQINISYSIIKKKTITWWKHLGYTFACNFLVGQKGLLIWENILSHSSYCHSYSYLRQNNLISLLKMSQY